MSERVVDELFVALFALTDLRQVLRDTKPAYKLSDEEKRQVREIVEKVRGSLSVIEGELLK